MYIFLCRHRQKKADKSLYRFIWSRCQGNIIFSRRFVTVFIEDLSIFIPGRDSLSFLLHNNIKLYARRAVFIEFDMALYSVMFHILIAPVIIMILNTVCNWVRFALIEPSACQSTSVTHGFIVTGVILRLSLCRVYSCPVLGF